MVSTGQKCRGIESNLSTTNTRLVDWREEGDVGLAVSRSSQEGRHLLDEAEQGGQALTLRRSDEWISYWSIYRQFEQECMDDLSLHRYP